MLPSDPILAATVVALLVLLASCGLALLIIASLCGGNRVHRENMRRTHRLVRQRKRDAKMRARVNRELHERAARRRRSLGY